MRSFIRHFMLLAALCFTGALTACLEEQKDPAAQATSAGKLGATFYANGLGNIALQIQSYIVNNPEWLQSVNSSQSLDMAAIGINPDVLGVNVRSHICPTGVNSAVRQIAWIQGTSSDAFSLKGIGSDSSGVVTALRSRLAGENVGIYRNGALEMSNGDRPAIPSSCGSLAIPAGAPVVVFNIERPAPPVAAMARTEYKTEACAPEANGRARRGTMVLKRVVTYTKEGDRIEGAWASENMGNCVEDVVVTMADPTTTKDGRNADLSAFAGKELQKLLEDQLKLDCVTATITSNIAKDGGRVQKTETVTSCGNRAVSQGTKGSVQTQQDDKSDNRTVQCTGSVSVVTMRFDNLKGNGTSVTAWSTGNASMRREVEKFTVDGVDTGRRTKWVGTTIDCRGGEDFTVACGNIPNNPSYSPRLSTQKWVDEGIQGYMVDTNWWSSTFGCWLGGCTEVVGGYIRFLNNNYFTGTQQYENGSTRTHRGMQATSWINPETFTPNPSPSTAWNIASNQCLWATRVMIVDCPFSYDASQQSTWAPGISPYHGMPVALDPGVPNNGTKAGEIYVSSIRGGSQGTPASACNSKGCYNSTYNTYREARLTSTVAMQWKKCNIKGCDYWWEVAGPGEGAYIKSWNNSGMNLHQIILSATARLVRTDLCADIAFKLDSQGAATQAVANAQAKNTVAAQKQEAYQTANTNYVNAQALLTQRQNSATVAQTIAQTSATTATNRRNAANAAATTAANLRAEATQKRAIANGATPPAGAAAAATAAENAADDAEDAAADADALADDAEATAATRASELTAAQNAVTAATTARNTAATARTNALNAYNTAQAEADAANAEAVAATAAANSGNGQALTADQRSILTELRSGLCASQGQALNSTQQGLTRSVCTQYYSSPSSFSYLPALGYFCDAVFDRSGSELSFKKPDLSSAGANVQTTLLNTDGLLLAYRPVLENNSRLLYRQNGVYSDPLHCARNEERYYSWPVLQYYTSCGGKGGCKVNSYYTTTTITETTVRQWAGYTYESGTWSRPSYGLRSPYGNWSNWNQVPNPIVSW